MWALFTEFDLDFSNGNVNQGDSKLGGAMLFQPVLPFPLYGSGDDEWKLITRPVVPIVFSAAIPTGPNEFDHEGGLADIQLPMLVSPPTGNWLLGAGVNWLFPTSTSEDLGHEQWGVGPTAVVGYKTKELTVGVFPQYYFGFASRGDRDSDVRDVSSLSMLYFAVLQPARRLADRLQSDHHLRSSGQFRQQVERAHRIDGGEDHVGSVGCRSSSSSASSTRS